MLSGIVRVMFCDPAPVIHFPTLMQDQELRNYYARHASVLYIDALYLRLSHASCQLFRNATGAVWLPSSRHTSVRYLRFIWDINPCIDRPIHYLAATGAFYIIQEYREQKDTLAAAQRRPTGFIQKSMNTSLLHYRTPTLTHYHGYPTFLANSSAELPAPLGYPRCAKLPYVPCA